MTMAWKPSAMTSSSEKKSEPCSSSVWLREPTAPDSNLKMATVARLLRFSKGTCRARETVFLGDGLLLCVRQHIDKLCQRAQQAPWAGVLERVCVARRWPVAVCAAAHQ